MRKVEVESPITLPNTISYWGVILSTALGVVPVGMAPKKANKNIK